MKSLSSKTYQCGVTIQGLTTLSGTVYLTGITNTASWDHVIVGTTAQGQIYTRTYAQFMGDVATGISLSSYVTGSGTTNYLPKFTGTSALGNSSIQDNGTTITISGLVLASISSVNASSMSIVNSSNNADINFNVCGSTAYGVTSWINKSVVEAAGNSQGLVLGTYGGDITLQTSARTERMRITSAGNVGIGTSTIYAKLSISSGNYNGIRIDTNGGGYSALNIGGTGALTVDAPGITGGRFQITDSGNVGIGTPSPQSTYKLTISGTDTIFPAIFLDNTTNSQAYSIRATGTNFVIRDNTSGNDRFTIASTGAATFRSTKGSITGTDVGNVNILDYAGYAAGVGGSLVFQSTYNSFNSIAGSGAINTIKENATDGNYAFGMEFYTRPHGSALTKQFSIASTGAATFSSSVSVNNAEILAKLDVVSSLAKTNTTFTRIASFRSNEASGSYPLELYIAQLGNATSSSQAISLQTGHYGLDFAANLAINADGGNVGIGTATPDSKLHIEGNTTGSGSGADAIVHIKQNGAWNGNEPWALYVEGYSYLNGFRVNAADGQRGLYTDAAQLGFAVGGNSPISFTQNTSDYRMYIAPGGNIGIGTTSPSAKLEISGFSTGAGLKLNYGNSSGTIEAINFIANGGANGVIGMQMVSAGVGDLWLGGSGGRSLTLYRDGNVGIGTTSPAGKLEVFSSSDNQLRLDASGTYSAMYLTQNQAVKGAVWMNHGLLGMFVGTTVSNGYLALGSDNSTERVRITAAGNVGIGDNGPSSKLQVAGDVRISGAGIAINGYDGGFLDYASGVFRIRGQNTTGGAIAFMTSANAASNVSTERMRITSAGNVGIGTTSPLFNLQVGANAGTLATTTIRLQNSYLDTNGYYGFNIDAVDNGIDGHDLRFLGRTSSTGAFSELIRIKNSGNVGIGTTSPGAKLEITTADSASTVYPLSLTNPNNQAGNGGGAGIKFSTSSGPGGAGNEANKYSSIEAFDVNNYGSNSGLSFTVSDGYTKSKAMVINRYGGVGIGTVSPSTLLDVSGVITATGGNSTNWNTAYGWGNHASASYVPQARTLTINGTSYDLSANRTWTIATSGNIQQAADNGKVTTAASVGTTVITTVATASYDGATFNYVLKDGTNYRAGTIIAVWSSSAVQYNETTTNDIGSTTGVTFAVALNAGNAELRATSATSGWTVKVVTIGI